MWTCKHCKINFDFVQPCDKANHSRWCKSNPRHQDYIDALVKNSDLNRVALMNESRIKSGRLNQFCIGGDNSVSKETRMKLSNSLKGYKHSEETKKNMSIGSLKSKHRRLMRHTVSYTTVDGSSILMDSSWEVELAKRLDFLKIKWIRPDPIPWTDLSGKIHNYFSDFYLIDYDLYVDPKNKAAYANQIEKINYINKNYNNVVILKTLEECKNYVPQKNLWSCGAIG